MICIWCGGFFVSILRGKAMTKVNDINSQGGKRSGSEYIITSSFNDFFPESSSNIELFSPCKNCQQKECFQIKRATQPNYRHLQFPYIKLPIQNIKPLNEEPIELQLFCKEKNRSTKYCVPKGHKDITLNQFKNVCPNGCEKNGSPVQANTNDMPLISELFFEDFEKHCRKSFKTKIYLCFQCKQLFRVSDNPLSVFSYSSMDTYFEEQVYLESSIFHFGNYGHDIEHLTQCHKELDRLGGFSYIISYDLQNNDNDLGMTHDIINIKYIYAIGQAEKALIKLIENGKYAPFNTYEKLEFIQHKFLEQATDLIILYLNEWANEILALLLTHNETFIQLDIIENISGFASWIAIMHTFDMFRTGKKRIIEELNKLPKPKIEDFYTEMNELYQITNPRKVGENLLRKMKNYPHLGNQFYK